MKATNFTLFLFLSFIGFGQTLPQINEIVDKELESNKFPALAVVVIDSGKVVHMDVRGYKDLEKKAKADIHTMFNIASIAKTMTNLAIFKLVEKGQIDLNTDINEYLPFAVRNPHHPDTKITVKDILNHRSGILDDYEFLKPYWFDTFGDSDIELVDFIKAYLSEDGKNYDKRHFQSKPNPKSFSYSNIGYALLGVVVEHVSGNDFEAFCQEHIFKPLHMQNTSWFLKDLDMEQIAKPYTYTDSLGYQFKGHLGYPDYPAGRLRTSISDFSKYLTGFLNVRSSKFIVEAETINKIVPIPEVSHHGYYTWFLTSLRDVLYYSHYGDSLGTSTYVIIDVYERRAVAVFANARVKVWDLLVAIEKEMWGK